MKTLVLILTSVFLLSSSLWAQAEKTVPVDTSQLEHPLEPALWKVEGKDLKKPSYLFGTIHLGDPRLTTLHPEAEKAFKVAGHFYAEIDLDPGKMAASVGMMMRKDGKTLSSSIGPDLTKKLDAALQAINPALSSRPFEPMKTWVMMTQLPVLELQLRGKTPLDAVLYQRAQNDSKKVGGLETLGSQLQIFDALKEEEQVLLLESTLDTLVEEKKEGKNSTKELVNLYLTGEITELGVLVKKMMAETSSAKGAEKELGQRLVKQLLDDRNIEMAQKISEALTKNPDTIHFFAVGVAHYTGENAIQDLLTKKGFTVTPLFD